MLLNYDVLLEVFSFLSRKNVSRAMCACRTLYLGCVPYLFEDEVKIHSRTKMLSLCAFTFRDTSRFRYLRGLSLFIPGEFKAHLKIDFIAAFFRHADHLERLKIFRCDFLDAENHISTAISSLPTLRSLTLHSPNCAAYHMLNTFQKAPLTSVEICFYSDDSDGPVDPVPVLRQLRDRLEELHVTWVELADTSVQYTAVHSLTVDDCCFALLAPIVHCFPHVRTLKMWMGQEDDHLAEDEIEEQRDINLAAQAACMWESLDELAGSVLSLYMLAVQCPVDRLVMTSDRLEVGPSCEMFLRVITDVRPTALATPRIDVSRIDLPTFGDMLAPLRGRLTLLAVDLEFDEYSADFMGVLVSYSPLACITLVLTTHQTKLVTAIDGHNLRSLFINVHWSYGRWLLMDNGGPGDENEMKLRLATYNSENLARVAIHHLPDLQLFYMWSYESVRH